MDSNSNTREPIRPSSAKRFGLEQAIVAAFESWWKGPRECLVKTYFTKDATLILHSPHHLSAFSGEHRGRDAILHAFRQLASEFHVSQPNIGSILTDGQHVAVAYSVRLKNIGTCKSGRVCGMAHITFNRRRQAIRLESFFDSAAMAEIGEMLESFAARCEALDRALGSKLASALKR